jgi:hypothetical protein
MFWSSPTVTLSDHYLAGCNDQPHLVGDAMHTKRRLTGLAATLMLAGALAAAPTAATPDTYYDMMDQVVKQITTVASAHTPDPTSDTYYDM